jgi:hypothetical protein
MVFNMKTLKKLELELVEVEFIPHVHEMDFGKIYYSREYQTTNHLCPCGCGIQTPIPVMEGGWKLTINNSKATLSPSILHKMGCETHYIITNGVANIV